MVKSNKARYLWIPLAGLILMACIWVVPYLYGAGKTQATLSASDTALGIRIDGVKEDVGENEADIKTLKSKFDAYHEAQTTVNTEILRRLPE